MGISEISWNISGISRGYLTSNSGHARAPVSLRTQSLLCVPTLWSAEWSSTQSLYPDACCWDGRSTPLTFRSLLDIPKCFIKRCSGRASANPSQETHSCQFLQRGGWLLHRVRTSTRTEDSACASTSLVSRVDAALSGTMCFGFFPQPAGVCVYMNERRISCLRGGRQAGTTSSGARGKIANASCLGRGPPPRIPRGKK